MANEIKPGTLTELLLKKALPLMRDKTIVSVEILLTDEMITLIYYLRSGELLRNTWKLEDL